MITLLYNIFTRSFVVLLISMLSINYLPDQLFHDYPFEPRTIDSNKYNSLVLEWNSALTQDSKQLEYIQLNQIKGPESMAISKAGLIYTGLADGRLVELDPMNKHKLRQVLRYNSKSENCKDNLIMRSDECGRFLQTRFHNDALYSVEVNSGLYKINPQTGLKMLLGPKPIAKTNLYNGFAFDPVEPNLVYITSSSTRWRLSQIMWSLMELEDSGQIIALDINTGKRVVILDKIMFPNGLDIDSKRDRIIYTETTISQVSSISLAEARSAFKAAKDGEIVKTVKPKVVISVLPGNPDNLIVEGDLAYIALPWVKLSGKELFDQLSDKPAIRKAVGRVVYGLGKVLEIICDKVYKHPLLEAASLELKSGHFLYYVVIKDKSGVIEYNLETNSQRFLGSDKFAYLSEAKHDGLGNLYLGSYDSTFLVRTKVATKK